MTFSRGTDQSNRWLLVATESSMSQNQEEEPVKMNQHETFVLIEVWKQLKEEGIIDNHQKNSLICARVKEEMAARDITKHCPVKMHRRIQALRREYNKVKDANSVSGNGRTSFVYFDAIDQFQSSSSLRTPKVLSDSHTEGVAVDDEDEDLEVVAVDEDSELEGSTDAFKSPPPKQGRGKSQPVTPKSEVKIKQEPDAPGRINNRAGAESAFVSGLSAIERHHINKEHELEVRRMEYQQKKDEAERLEKEKTRELDDARAREDRSLQLELAKVNADMMTSLLSKV